MSTNDFYLTNMRLYLKIQDHYIVGNFNDFGDLDDNDHLGCFGHVDIFSN